jgi:hypothetical protein
MELLHICVGRTRVHTINDHSVSTAYLKEAVNGREEHDTTPNVPRLSQSS